MEKQMDDNRYWFNIWFIVALVISTIVGSITLCMVIEDILVTKQALAGIDPIKAKCSMGVSDGAVANITCLNYSK
jgi:ABC-type Na+ efflux pump permease subunit